MRFALWLLALFGVAVAGAALVGNNQAGVTVFWPPYRIDLSFNLVLLLLLALFAIMYVAVRALALLWSLPGQAQRWRLQRLDQKAHAGLLDAMSHLAAGRFIRARKAAEQVVTQAQVLEAQHKDGHAQRLQVFAHLLAADSAHALRDQAARDLHLQAANEQTTGREFAEVREGLLLRTVRWHIDDRTPADALQALETLSHGVARRTLALRLRFKAARMAQRPELALETARLLAKHRAFAPLAVPGIMRSLAIALMNAAHDPEQLRKVWDQFDRQERAMADVAIEAAERLLRLQGDTALALQWLQPVWDDVVRQGPAAQPQTSRVRLVRVLQQAFARMDGQLDPAWLARVEGASRAQPGDALWLYLTGVACLHSGLWGKAERALRLCLPLLGEQPELRSQAWRMLARLAEQRGDTAAQIDAWRHVATE